MALKGLKYSKKKAVEVREYQTRCIVLLEFALCFKVHVTLLKLYELPCSGKWYGVRFTHSVLKNVQSTHKGVVLLVKLQALLKVTFHHGCFSRFLNCTSGTNNAAHLIYSLRVAETNLKERIYFGGTEAQPGSPKTFKMESFSTVVNS